MSLGEENEPMKKDGAVGARDMSRKYLPPPLQQVQLSRPGDLGSRRSPYSLFWPMLVGSDLASSQLGSLFTKDLLCPVVL